MLLTVGRKVEFIISKPFGSVSKNFMNASATLQNGFQPTRKYIFKVNNRNTRTRCEICSKLTKKTPE